jgi:cation diffusion facilitator CzcD-associated flavoprotein CzcO
MRYESRALAFTRMRVLLEVAIGWPFKALLKKQVADLVLRKQLTPDYAIGCKRILLSSDYLTTMGRDNVELVTTTVSQVTATGVETSDGKVHQADVLIYGTGFAATDFLAPMKVTGRHGQALNDVWQQGAKAYLGISVPGFPNFFMVYGPNTNLGHNSIIYMLESQIAHIMACLARMKDKSGRTIEVNAGRYQHFTDAVQVRLANSVWAGCRSWYIDDNGHNSASWPGFTLSYRWLTRHPPRDAYRVA